jgi:hypothetical protein
VVSRENVAVGVGSENKKARDNSGMERPRASCGKNVELTDFHSGKSELINIHSWESQATTILNLSEVTNFLKISRTDEVTRVV